jgi:hypothetical protein
MYFFQYLIIKTLDPSPDSLEMLDPDSYPDPVPQHCLSKETFFLLLKNI